ncbi:MAG: hypothetical protein AAF384_11280 [Pseudomonadota bacterium]
MACDHRLALEFAKAGDWHSAHEMVQDFGDELSCLIHAYLHRLEGDLRNARYWYRQASITPPENTIAEELERLSALV